MHPVAWKVHYAKFAELIGGVFRERLAGTELGIERPRMFDVVMEPIRNGHPSLRRSANNADKLPGEVGEPPPLA